MSKKLPRGATVVFSTVDQKVIIDFGFILKKICQQDFSKIAQSGHTGRGDLYVVGLSAEPATLVLTSVTRFGKISSLWQKFENLWETFEC